jgi:Fe2+ or Zn2+ uptake regulation protein
MHRNAEEIELLLRERGLSLTPQRRAIVRRLTEHGGHWSAAEVLERVTGEFPMASRATVYSTLALLRDLGVLVALPAEWRAALTPIRIPTIFVCLRCSELEDIQEVVPSRGRQAAPSRDRSLQVVVEGVCGACIPRPAPLAPFLPAHKTAIRPIPVKAGLSRGHNRPRGSWVRGYRARRSDLGPQMTDRAARGSPAVGVRPHAEPVDRVFEQLRSRILSGAFPAGEQLPNERELATALHVNRASVREAVKRLEFLSSRGPPRQGPSCGAVRLLRAASGRGVAATRPSTRDLPEQLLVFRRHITLGRGLAASHRS